jgi:SAM-dependent methyltransferase
MSDPLSGSSWSAPGTVESFSRSAPNATLVAFADAERHERATVRAIDIGCGAGRNAVPLAQHGWTVLGTDLSLAMLAAASSRAAREQVARRIAFALAPMDALPAAEASADLVIAHGIWNLARSEEEFRRAVREGARVAREHGALFVFTFSRSTLPPDAMPVDGTTFVFTQFSGQPQCFLTEAQLIDELSAAGFTLDSSTPLRELNRRPPGSLATGAPVIYEGVFRKARR